MFRTTHEANGCLAVTKERQKRQQSQQPFLRGPRPLLAARTPALGSREPPPRARPLGPEGRGVSGRACSPALLGGERAQTPDWSGEATGHGDALPVREGGAQRAARRGLTGSPPEGAALMGARLLAHAGLLAEDVQILLGSRWGCARQIHPKLEEAENAFAAASPRNILAQPAGVTRAGLVRELRSAPRAAQRPPRGGALCVARGGWSGAPR